MVAKLALCAVLFLSADSKDPKDSAGAAKPAVTKPAATQPAVVQPAAAPPAKKKIELIAVERIVVDRTNAERARYGLPPLEVDEDLMQSARAHATWMTVNQTMQHTRQPVAENIAMGQPDGQSVVQCWMNSSGHRANILNWGHQRIGVAAYQTLQGTIFWCQQFR
ncbi:MAG: CAP domain-containing protein [Thermoguttaceae bacterium]